MAGTSPGTGTPRPDDDQGHDGESERDGQERADRRDPPQADPGPPDQVPDEQMHKRATESAASPEAAQAYRAAQRQRPRAGGQSVIRAGQSMRPRAGGMNHPARAGRKSKAHSPKSATAGAWAGRGSGTKPHGFRKDWREPARPLLCDTV